MESVIIHLFTGFWSCLFFGLLFIITLGWTLTALIDFWRTFFNYLERRKCKNEKRKEL